MKTQSAVRILSVLLSLACVALPALAASFSADLVDTRAGQTRTGPFHYQDKSYRFEVGENTRALVILVDGPSGTMRLMNPAEKAYYEAGPSEPMSLFANPFALYAHYSKIKDVRTEGTESVDGIPCKKQVVSGGEQVYVTAWVADEFDLPLKVQTVLDGRTIELRNIKRGPQEPALFALPVGYQRNVVEEKKDPQPEWVGQVAGAPLLTPPFEKTLAAGEIVRLRPQAGRWVMIQGTNTGPSQGSFTAAPFKGGKYIGGGSMSALILDAGDSGAMTDGARSSAAEEIVVRVDEGTMKIKISFVAPRPMGSGAAPAAGETATAPAAAEVSAEVSAPESAEVATRIEVAWKGPANPDDTIAVARRDQPPGASVHRTNVREGNPLKVWMPSDPGEYEVRYILGRGAQVLAKAPVTVTAVTAKVVATGPVSVAAWIEVNWEGPARDGDYISVAGPNQPPGANAGNTLVKAGNPLKVRAPSDPGDYEVRYILARGARLLAKTPITITPVTAEVTAPAAATAGAEFEVRWQGPGYPEDFISLARVNQPPGGHVNKVSVLKGSPGKLRAPKEPGSYEVRYVLGRGNRLLTKMTIAITAPEAKN
jgi:hypothetical protein